ncbi:PPC domain-containing protein [Gimesia maris]|uniref:PPC domain-containing protein n=1 Tax=Gimesia maris TaxID=122 RepID=UPI0018D6457D|nr:PPC domain-containing protein [Gimesia maris]
MPLFAAPPELESLFPFSCQAGTTAEIKLKGKHLKDIRQSQVTAPGVSVKVLDDKRLQINVEKQTTAGIYNLRLLTDDGLSQPYPVQITAWPTLTATEKSDQPDSTLKLPLPGGVDARFEHTGDIDWYAFAGKKDQQITLRCRSKSLGGSATPLMTLIAPDGEEIAFASPQQREPVLHVKLPNSGTYQVKVFNRAYSSDPSALYHLSVNSKPRLLAAFPALINSGQPAKVTIQGISLPGVSQNATQILQQKEITVDPEKRTASHQPDSPLTNRFHLSVPELEGTVPLMLTDLPVVVDHEPGNQSQKTAQKIKVPCDIAGQFLKPRDLDWYQFTAEKGQELSIQAFGEQLDQQMDLELALLDSSGKVLKSLTNKAELKGNATPVSATSLDPEGTWKAPKADTYSLLVRDLYGSSLGGFDRQYRVRIENKQPDFQAYAYPATSDRYSGVSLHQGGHTHVTIYVDRRHGFSEPIRIQAVDLPEGLSADEVIIPAHQSEARFSIFTSKNAPQTIVPLSLKAIATVQDQEVVKQVRPQTVSRSGSFQQVATLAAGTAKAAPFNMTIKPQQGKRTLGEKIELDVQWESAGSEISGKPVLKWHIDLVDAKGKQASLIKPVTSLDLKQSEHTLTAQLPKKMQPGQYSLWLSATLNVTPPQSTDKKQKKQKPVPFEAVSNIITLEIQPLPNKKNNIQPRKKAIKVKDKATLISQQ